MTAAIIGHIANRLPKRNTATEPVPTATPEGKQLRAAAALIRDRGLSKGSPNGPDGSICTMRALLLVSPSASCYAALRERVLDVVQPRRESLPDWNDEEDRTEEEVVAAFENAADLADAELVAA